MISDELLMRYADGDPDLTAEERHAVREALSRDAALLARLEAYLFTGRMLAVVVKVDENPVLTKRLTEMIARAPLGSPYPVASGRAPSTWEVVREFAARMRLPAWSIVAAPAAAGAVLAALSLWLLQPARQQELALHDNFVGSPAMQRALEETESGATRQLEDRPSLRPSYSFFTNDQTLCRRFDLHYPNSLRATGAACRDKSGAWRLHGQTAAVAYVGPDRVGPADRPELQALDAIEDRIIAGDRLSGEPERRVKANGWKKAP
jgi:hypothetical protein